MEDVTMIIDTYLEAYGEVDADRRQKLVELAWDPNGRLVDPPLAAEGHDAISEQAVAVKTHFPGHSFRRTTGIDAHHEFVRFGWELVGPDGAIAIAGYDVGELAEDGRLRRITGFFGDPPALEEQ